MTIIKRNKYMTTLLFSAGILCVAVASIATVREMNSKPVAQVQKNPVEDPFYNPKEHSFLQMEENPFQENLIKDASSWLALIDAGKYDEGYKQMNTEDANFPGLSEFSDIISKVRAPLGKMVSRTYNEITFGEKVDSMRVYIVSFTTTFENKEKMEEKVNFIETRPYDEGYWFRGGTEQKISGYSLE